MQTISIKNTWVWFKDQMTHPSTLFSKTSWGVFSPYAHYRRSDHRPKQTYATREKALSVAKEMGMKYGGSYSIYKCVFCDGWHVAKDSHEEQPQKKVSQEPGYVPTSKTLDVKKILATNIPDIHPVYGGVLQEATSSIRKLEREQAESHDKPVVAYEVNMGIHQDMEFFFPIYKAIRDKQALRIVRHKQFDESITDELILYPEFLRQYNTLWHVFGVATTLDGKVLTAPCERIPLHVITSATPLSSKQYPFIASGIEDYLEDYFSEIIGVDNDPSEPVSDIRFAVKNNTVHRLMNNPLHESMVHLKGETCPLPGYQMFRMQVKVNMELYRKLLRWGSKIIVLSPSKLRSGILKDLHKTLRLYEISAKNI